MSRRRTRLPAQRPARPGQRSDFERLRRQIRLVCLVLVPLVACTTTALGLWGDARAGRPFEPHAIFSGIGLIGWGFAVFVLSRPALTIAERMRDDWRANRERTKPKHSGKERK